MRELVGLRTRPTAALLSVHDIAGLNAIGTALDRLHADMAVPVTARRPWLATWLRCHPSFEPWVFTLIDPDTAELQAAVPLARRRRRGLTEVVAAGHGSSDQIRFPARGGQAALEISVAVVRGLRQLDGPWCLRAQQLPPGDPVAGFLRAQLRWAALLDGWGSPRIRLGADANEHTSHNYRGQARNMCSRLRRHGHEPRFVFLRDPVEIAARMPEIEAVCKAREVQLAGRSRLDDPAEAAFFRAVIAEHASRGEVELGLLQTKGGIAAYSVAFVDRGAYRQWSKHLAPRWAAYRPGHVLDFELLRRAVADPDLVEFDWMMGVEGYKLRTATEVWSACDLLAWSSPGVAACATPTRLLRAAVEPHASQDGWLRRGVEAARRLRVRARRMSR